MEAVGSALTDDAVDCGTGSELVVIHNDSENDDSDLKMIILMMDVVFVAVTILEVHSLVILMLILTEILTSHHCTFS